MKEKQEKDILEFLQRNQYASIEELANRLFVSPSTIRRKLNDLQKKGLITRTHGGAQLNDDNNFFPSFTFRVHENSYEKKKIALSAIKLIKNGDLIFLDGTTSSFFIAEYLSEFKNIRVITNGIDTLSLLAKNNISAYSTGGCIQDVNRSVLVGHYAEEMIGNFHADIAFFSARSVTNDGEIYDCFEEENVIRKAMIKHATKKVFLCDTTKFGKTSLFHLCSLNDIDYIVTNYNIPSYVKADKFPQIITE
ncbi:MAG: DeoR/GlpR transcriptional regulator [Clostridiales bacterium]|nr:DeoR/GlpR transcriptional regulator [Clostridiales bacterium]